MRRRRQLQGDPSRTPSLHRRGGVAAASAGPFWATGKTRHSTAAAPFSSCRGGGAGVAAGGRAPWSPFFCRSWPAGSAAAAGGGRRPFLRSSIRRPLRPPAAGNQLPSAAAPRRARPPALLHPQCGPPHHPSLIISARGSRPLPRSSPASAPAPPPPPPPAPQRERDPPRPSAPAGDARNLPPWRWRGRAAQAAARQPPTHTEAQCGRARAFSLRAGSLQA